MTVFKRIYVDANILITMTETRETPGVLLREIPDRHSTHRPPLFLTSELTLSEVLVKPYRDGNEELSAIYAHMLSGEHWLGTISVNLEVLEKAATLRSTYGKIKLPDAIHLASAVASGCSHMLTNDAGLSDLAPSRHPFKNEILPALTIIRSNDFTISEILEELTQ
jgi:predicted nucleic acid-binding protein